MRGHRREIYICFLVLMLLMAVVLCGCINQEGLHVNYAGNTGKYGRGNYLYSTVTFTGEGFGREKIFSVKELEETAKKNRSIGYENQYSLLTSGGIFSKKTFTGDRLYRLLLNSGMKKNLPGDTTVTITAADGYSEFMTLNDLRSKGYCRYSSKSAKQPEEKNLPVLLAFGTEGKPLVGPTGGQNIGKKMSKAEGYDKDADNEGGPVRLILGQTSAGQYNAPNNVKWVSYVTVGRNVNYIRHAESAKTKKVLTIAAFDHEKNNRLIMRENISAGEIERFAAHKENNERNYYGEKHFYEGADLWKYIKKKTGAYAYEGKIKFTFADGGSETLSMDYLKNVAGEDSGYYTKGRQDNFRSDAGAGLQCGWKPFEEREALCCSSCVPQHEENNNSKRMHRN